MIVDMKVPICHPYKEIGKQIKTARLAKEMTQSELANLAGVSKRSLIRLEKGKRFNIDWLEMLAIEEVLEIQVTALIRKSS